MSRSPSYSLTNQGCPSLQFGCFIFCSFCFGLGVRPSLPLVAGEGVLVNSLWLGSCCQELLEPLFCFRLCVLSPPGLHYHPLVVASAGVPVLQVAFPAACVGLFVSLPLGEFCPDLLWCRCVWQVPLEFAAGAKVLVAHHHVHCQHFVSPCRVGCPPLPFYCRGERDFR